MSNISSPSFRLSQRYLFRADSDRGKLAKPSTPPPKLMFDWNWYFLLDGIDGSRGSHGTFPESHAPSRSIEQQTPQVPNESQGIPANTELDLLQSVDRLCEQSAGFSPTPLRTMKRKGFPSGMKYPFENPDATYPSPNGSKPILERIIAPPSISSLSQIVMTNAPTQHMEEIAETEAQELPQSGSQSRSPNRGSAFGGRGYPRGRARGRGSGRGRGRGRGPGPGKMWGHGRGRSCRVGRPRARRGLSDMNRTTAGGDADGWGHR